MFRPRYLIGILIIIFLQGQEISSCYSREPAEMGLRLNTDDSLGSGWINYKLADPLKIEISYAGLEGDERRSRENHKGESFFDGINYQLEIRSWIEFGKFITFNINPKLIGWDNKDNNEFVLKEAYGRFTLSNLELEVGRDSLWWGPGYHGALLISDNAFPFDMIKIGSDKPFKLPWILDRLGYFRVSSFLTRLEKERDFSRTKLFGLRFELSPFSFLDLGLSRVTMFNGEGRSGLSFKDFLKLYFSNPNREEPKFDVNELASVDFRARIWSVELYGEIGGEDEAGFRPTKNGYLFGIYLPNLLKNDRMNLRVEYANNHVSGSPDVWYNHHVYTSGYTFENEIIGHHMGSDADDLFIRIERHLADGFKIGLQSDMERHGLSDKVIEKKKEAAIDIEIFIKKGLHYIIGYEYEGIENKNIDGINTEGVDAINHYIWTSFSLFF